MLFSVGQLEMHSVGHLDKHLKLDCIGKCYLRCIDLEIISKMFSLGHKKYLQRMPPVG